MKKGSQIKVLVFCESEMYTAGLCCALAANDGLQEIMQVSTREEYLNVFSRFHPDVAVIVLNDSEIMVSELVRALRNSDPDLLILLIGDTDEHWLEAFTWKANGYLPRSASKSELIRAIHEIYEGKMAFEPGVDGVIQFEEELAKQFELSDRELDVFRFIVLEKKDKEIAEMLGLSQHTIRNHVRHVLYKLGCKRKADVLTRDFHQGYVLVS